MPNGCTNVLVVGRSTNLAQVQERATTFDFEVDAVVSLGVDSNEGPEGPIPVYSWGHNVEPNKVVDIAGIKVLFLTSSCSGIESPVDLLISKEFGTETVSNAGDQLTPWYHFVPGPYYESEPFYSKGRGTKLVFLDRFDGTDKWAHLVRMGPAVNPSRPLSGVNLYASTSSHPADLIWGAPEFKRAPLDTFRGSDVERGSKKLKRACYMCLDSPAATQELVVATGEKIYLCTARGPIQSDEIHAKLKCAGHVLLIPRSHIPSVARNGKSDDQLELRKFEIALGSMYRQYDLEPVTYEFVRDRSVHGHTQVVPIPSRLVQETLQQMKSALVNRGMAISAQVPAGDYLAVRVSDRPCIFVQLPSRNVDLQLPRAVLCQVLGLGADAADWKKCLLENEPQDALEMQKAFKPFDFLSG